MKQIVKMKKYIATTYGIHSARYSKTRLFEFVIDIGYDYLYLRIGIFGKHFWISI